MSHRKLLKNIKSLAGIQTQPHSYLKGEAMSVLECIDNAFLVTEGEQIMDFGPMSVCPTNVDEVVDISERIVLPSWVDSHTHLVFAEPRNHEYVMRLKGKSYEEIANEGGGILNSAIKLALYSEDDLYVSAAKRLKEVISLGTGAIEIKSGYGLSVDNEIKILRVIQRLKRDFTIPIKATFLGAHGIPTIYKDDRERYIDLVVNEMLPIIKEERLADYIDVFCDKGFFTVDETSKILEAGYKYGLKPKIHANELANSGGVQVGIKHNAISVDHLEMIGDQEILDLLDSETIPTVLPSVSFFLGIPYAPARKMIDAGLGVTIASDYNPGSSPSGNIPFLLSLACNMMRLLPSEAINATTLNGAYAIELQDKLGSITKGKWANLIVTSAINDISHLPYAFGSKQIDKVMIKGQWIE